METLLLVSFFGAFFLAILDGALRYFDFYLTGAYRALASLLISLIGTGLLFTKQSVTQSIVILFASAFASSFLVALADRITSIPMSAPRAVGQKEFRV